MPWSEPAGFEPVRLAAFAIAACIVSVLGSFWAIAHARRKNLIDQPGDRRSHGVPTPRGGGIGIVVVALLACALLARTSNAQATWTLIGAGLLLVAGIGWWDDHRSLPAWPRLLVHACAAACLALAVYLQGTGVLAAIAAFVVALVLVNAWNFMDGINGLAASQAMLCGIGFALLPIDAGRVLAIAVAAACLGFLPFNVPKARVFLGDVGSGALGYLVAVLLALGFASQPLSKWPLLLLPPLAMLADAGLTLLWRIRRGERWWQPHVQHAYQRWSRAQGHAVVALAYGCWTLLALGVMLALQHRGGAVVVLAGWMAVSALAWRWLHHGYDR